MNLIRRFMSTPQYLLPSHTPPKCIFLLPNCTISIQQFSPFSTTSKSTSTTKYLKSQQPKNPKSSPSLSWVQTIKKKALKKESLKKELLTWPKPSEILYESKNVNFVNLIGKIEMPIQFQATPDGKHIAVALIGQKDCIFNGNFSSSLLVPIVFEGDLAHIVACHVKVNDFVYVNGKLSLDPLPFDFSGSEGKFYVNGDELKFVQGLGLQGSDNVEKDVGIDSVVNEEVGNRKSSVDKDTLVKKEWEEFIAEPNQWSVVTSEDDFLKGAVEGVERKVDGKRLDLDSSTPVWVYKKLEELNFENKTEEMKIERLDTENRNEEMTIEPLNIEKKIEEIKIKPLNTEKKKSSGNVGGTPKDGESVLNSWRDLVKNPMDWRDYREKKSSGSFKANYPDFKHKTNGTALWLNNAPNWVLPGLGGLDVDAQAQVPKWQGAKGGKGKNEDSWKSLVENPDKWWDNRSRKTNLKAPDFKHKETGEALWLNSSPEWALSQLPPSKNEQNFAAGNKKAFLA
ncbi:DNA metabolism protein [Lithospermum erythrorhizon]|uniref:DNA metabolism protein n=1 Tax=Lithospermum erythrorhizon TaxID=34254 RepID=A0AAV3Q5Z3_LITER